jgi:hypothetical protein
MKKALYGVLPFLLLLAAPSPALAVVDFNLFVGADFDYQSYSTRLVFSLN